MVAGSKQLISFVQVGPPWHEHDVVRLLNRLRRQPQIKDNLKNDDDLKNEDNFKNEDDLKNKDNLKNEDDLKKKRRPQK